MTVMIRDCKEKGRVDRDPILYTLLILVPLNIGAATNSTKTPIMRYIVNLGMRLSMANQLNARIVRAKLRY